MKSRIALSGVDLPRFFGSVKVGERGQVVIPQEARTRMGIRPGEKLLAIGGLPGGAGLFLIKPETFNAVMAEVIAKLSSVEKLLRMAEPVDGEAGRNPSGGSSARKRTRRSRT